MGDTGGSKSSLTSVLLKTKYEEPFDKTKCVICQINTNETVTSSENGQKRIRDAAEIRNDHVQKRLKLMTEEDRVVYHCNNKCYKSYTLKKTLDKICQKTPQCSEEPAEDNTVKDQGHPLRRSLTSARPPPSAHLKPEDLQCVICGSDRIKVKGVNDRKKYRICESKRANTFLSAASYFGDEVFSRVADLNSDTKVFAADLYSHPNCMRLYIRKYECAINSKPHSHQSSNKFTLFERANEILEPLLIAGYGFTLSDIRQLMANFDDTVVIHNNEVKIFLVRVYKDKIRFCDSNRKNEPLMVFSADLTPEVLAAKIRSQDTVKSAGTILRGSLKDCDFGLNDKFCDVSDLQKSWESVTMPDAVLTFFSSLFNVSKTKLFQTRAPEFGVEAEDSGDDIEDTCEDLEDKHLNQLTVQMNSLFQIMFYQIHRGKKKTPLHMMTGHALYDKCKSKELITSMNRIGVSTSYNDVVRSRDLLAAYAVKSGESTSVPIPSHFSKKEFTIGALDNFDFEDNSSLSGTSSTHDTVMVLFQDFSNDVLNGKGSVKAAGINKRSCKLATQLPCQKVQSYHKPLKRPSLQEDFQVAEDINIVISDTAVTEAEAKEFLISLVRSGIKDEENPVPTWAGIHALTSKKTVPLKKVGFLPVIPYPVTNYSTVFTALKNFQNVRAQLEDQPTLPVFCDEGVFHIVAEILMNNPADFCDLYPMMGAFHMTKVALRCAGTYLSGCGIEDGLIETEIYGSKTVQSVMSGSHYVRSLQGMLIISETLDTLRWSAFWKNYNKLDYTDLISEVKKARDSLQAKDVLQSQKMFQALRLKSQNLKSRFEKFVKECEEKSELCKYWGNVSSIINLLKNLVHADREGDWELHVKTVESLLPIFHEFDCINYVRYGSWYLERVKKMEVENPYLYNKFIQGHFVVKDKEGRFNSVAPDMKLEQTIQRSQKSSKGIVGQTRKCDYVTRWELVYHEILSICNAFRDITNSKLMDHRETAPHHDLIGKRGERFNENVGRLVRFMQQHENPFEMTHPIRLHNFVTKQFVNDDIKKRILDVQQHALEVYRQLKQERFVSKTKSLFDTISKCKYPRFDSHSNSRSEQAITQKGTKKSLSQAHRDLDVAKERGERIQDILSHDLLPTNALFDGDFPAKPVKHRLVQEIEKSLSPEDLRFDQMSSLQTAVVVDYMSQLRMVKISAMPNFGAAIRTVLQTSQAVCSLQELHIVFDSYRELSIKESERTRRMSTCGTIDLASITNSTPVPVQLDKFWSLTNKTKLETLTRQNISEFSINTEFPIIVGAITVNEQMVPAEKYSKGNCRVVEELNRALEEADLRIVPHVHWAMRNGSRRVLVLSNDTDVVVLLLRFVELFLNQGLSELWVRYGTGERRRFIPLHVLYRKLPPGLPNVLIKAHILTGDDTVSKIGTKLGALTADPVKFLKEFAETEEENDFEKTEKYLVCVWKRNSDCETFDDLRYSEFKRSVPLTDLPPTSYSIQGHIKRAFYIIRNCLNVLNPTYVEKDPCSFGWEEVNGVLKPVNFLNRLPSELTRVCSCKTCATKRCPCRNALLICSTYCKCTVQDCKNK